MTGEADTGTESSKGAGATFALVFLLYMLNYMDRNVMSAVGEYLKRDLLLTDGQLGAAGSVFLACVAGCAVPAAFLADRWDRRKALAVMALAWSAATALTGFATGFASLLLARGLVGVGEAGFSSGGTAALSEVYPPERRGRVLGLFNASIPLGGALGTVLGAALARRTGQWSTPFYCFAVPGFLLAAWAWSSRPARVRAASSGTSAAGFARTLGTLWRVPTLRFVYMAFAANMVITSAMLFWLPSYFARTYHLPLDLAGRRAALPLLMALVGSPLGGWVADRWTRTNPAGRALTCAVFSLVSAGLLTLALALGGGRATMLALLVWGLFASGFSAPAAAITQDVVPAHLRATAYGACVLAMYLLGGAWSPFLVGVLSDRVGDVGLALRALPLAGVVAAALFHRAARHYAADHAAVG